MDHFPSIHLRLEDPTPLYQQIADQISLAVLQRALLPGEHLPPIRTLATLLQVSPITVTQAYRSLARAGLAGGQTGRGTFVLPLPTATPPPSSEVVTSARLTPLPAARDGDGWESVLAGLPGRAGPARSVALGQAFAKLLGALAPESQRDLIELSGGNPEPSLFSLAHWQEIMAEAGRSLDRESSRPDTARALQYGPALGDPALRTFLSSYLGRIGIVASSEEMLLTSGTQQGLDLVARTLFAPGDTVFVEQYSYISALDIFDQYSVQLRAVPLDQDGLHIEELERMLGVRQPRPRWLYTVPTGQSPTGAILAAERRRRLVEAASRYNLMILEDDAFNDLAYDPATLPPPLASLQPRGHVMYLKSFSKTVFPAARLGCLVADPAVITAVARQKGLMDRGTSLLVARTLLAYLSSPAYAPNVEEMRRLYRQRRDVLLSALERELAGLGCRWTTPGAGFSLLVTLPSGVNEMQAMAEATTAGVVAACGRFFATPVPAGDREPTLRLTFGDRSPEQLEEAARRLGHAIQHLVDRGPSVPLLQLPHPVVTDV